MDLFGSGSGSGSGAPSSAENCTLRYDSASYKVLAGLRASVGFISFLCCLLVVFIIILFKKYRFFTQRLVLNVSVAAMIHSLSYTTSRVNYYTVRPINDPYCYFGGLFNHYTAAVELISIWIATINIITLVVFRKNVSKFEGVWYPITYLLPLLWFWVPIWLGAYGTSGAWCGLKSVDEDCSPFKVSLYIQYGIWYIPLYVSMFIIITSLFGVACKVVRIMRRWKGKYDPAMEARKKSLQKEIHLLIWYPIIYLVLNSFSLVSQIYRAIYPHSSSIVLSYLRVLSSPLRGAFIALVFSLDKDTRRRLTPANFKAAYSEWTNKRDVVALETTTMYSAEEEPLQDIDYSPLPYK